MVTDFVYDGRALSSVGFMICGFDSDLGELGTVTTDSQRAFEHMSLYDGKFQPFSAVTYDEVYVPTLSCCKNPCSYEDFTITQGQMSELKRWLSPPTKKKLKINNDPQYWGFYWEGIFNIEQVWANGKRVGFNLTFESDRPYALRDAVNLSGTVSKGSSFTVTDPSDDEGYTYPTLKITCNESGTLELANSYDNRKTIINNCVSGEEITFTPEMQLSSSVATHTLSDDFNWKFLRVGNTRKERRNIISCPTIGIDYEITFNPNVKAVFAQ